MKTLLIVCIAIGPASARPVVLKSEKREYLLGEPVYLVAVPDAPRFLSLEEGDVTLQISDTKGESFSYQTPLMVCRGLGSEAPDLTFMTVIFSRGELVFKNSGTYTLELYSKTENPEPISEPLVISVVSPQSDADVRAYKIISESPSEYAFAVYLEGGDHLVKGMDILDRLESFPNSYQKASRFIHAINASRNFVNYRQGTVREANLDKAIEEAESVQGSIGPYAHLEMAKYLKERLGEQSAHGKRVGESLKSRIAAFAIRASSNSPQGRYTLKAEVDSN